MKYGVNYYPNNYSLNNLNNERFILPFLGGALVGGAAVGLTRPRPIYNVAPNYGGGYPYYGGPYPYGNYSYNYYYPNRPF